MDFTTAREFASAKARILYVKNKCNLGEAS